ncbi:MAG TPA: SGNH/GDSL hydrolase family protein [Mucilaginibacter sp.]|jgi:hypothetical protein|nr:SGNH/GDSL hydrolase family protein [Mucilaginibacter sp.]
MKTKFLLPAMLAFALTSNVLPAMAQAQTIKREPIEWLDVYIPNTNDSALPRILIIGNSLARGYYPEVAKLMEGKAYVARLSTTKSVCDPALIKEIDLIMSYHKFDIVEFDNGLHGFGYTEEQYKQAFPGFVKAIRDNAPNAKLIWATLTPLHTRADAKVFLPIIERIKARNKIALDYITSQKNIRVDDLWAATIDHPEYYQGGDGAHPIPSGYTALAQHVAAELTGILNEK